MGILYVDIGLIIINFIASVVNVVIGIINKRAISLLVGLFCLIVTILLAISTVNIYNSEMTQAKEKSEIEAYYKIRETIEYIKTDTTISNKTEILFLLQPKVDELNDLIEEHKTHYNSWWDGFMYSEKIGSLEKIRLY